MTRIVPRLYAVATAMVVATGLAGIAFAQSGAPAAAGAQPQQGAEQPGQRTDSSAAGPAGATRPLEQPILYVTDIEVLRTASEPKIDIIRVTGLVSSQGWSGPTLVPFFYGRPADDVLDLQLIATSPQQSQKAEGFVPVSAIFTLDAGHTYKGVRVRAATNAIEVKQLPGKVQATIKVDDGKDVVGKKYAEKGPAGPGVVTDADLPRGFRTITPSHGVAGIVHNPNRLNLILDGDNKVVMAFWE